MMSSRVVNTVCPYCGVGCGMALRVCDDHVVGVEPVPSHPASKGKLCVKGWNTPFALSDKDRIKTPLIREGKHFRKASWDEAISALASKFQNIIERHGSESVGAISCARATNEDNYAVQKLVRSVFKNNNIDHCARICHSPSVAGLKQTLGSGAMTNSIADIGESDLIVIFGCDPTENHTVLGGQIIEAHLKGTPLIVVDPRKTRLAHLADLHLQLNLGSNISLINGVLNILFDKDWADQSFIGERCENVVELQEKVKEYPIDRVCRDTGLVEQQLIDFARRYSHAKKAFLAYGMGITQFVSGTNNVIALSNLVLSCGHIGKPGAGINPLRGQNNVQGACDMGALPNVYPGYQDALSSEVISKFEKVWGGDLPVTKGLTSIGMTESMLLGGFKGLIIFGEDPVVTDPDQNRVARAFNQLDCLVVVEMQMTETAKMADIILPACSFAEKDGTFTNCERRVQKINKAIEPVGESKPDWQIAGLIASALDLDNSMRWLSVEAVFDEMASLNSLYSGMNYHKLEHQFGLQWPCNEEHPEGTTILHQESFPTGKGKEGKARFVPVSFTEIDEPADEQYPLLLTTHRVHFQYGCGSMTRKSPLLEREIPDGILFMNKQDAKHYSLNDHDSVGVRSRRGYLETRVILTDDLPVGLVSMPYHFKDAPSNQLTSTAQDPVTKMPELKACAVSVEVLPGGRAPKPIQQLRESLNL